jgi:hypothetical protein
LLTFFIKLFPIEMTSYILLLEKCLIILTDFP